MTFALNDGGLEDALREALGAPRRTSGGPPATWTLSAATVEGYRAASRAEAAARKATEDAETIAEAQRAAAAAEARVEELRALAEPDPLTAVRRRSTDLKATISAAIQAPNTTEN